MNCFRFLNEEDDKESPTTKSMSVQPTSAASIDCDMSKLEAESSGSQIVSDTRTDSLERSELPSFFQRPSNLRIFHFSELKNVTRNFSRSLMVGEGGFGRVYRGTIKNSEDPHVRLDVAVKQLNRKGLQGHKEWLNEVTVLGVVEHPNLVKLVGYCAENDERGMQRLLIYEFMPNGSVEDHLSSRTAAPLSWPMRLRIALDAARGLAYLHEGMDFQIIFRDFKTSNILLDENWNAKLSDFGLARQGPTEGLTHVSTAVVGTMGYAAPEYMQTGHLTAKSDIWSYGVFLYELITGRRPLDRNRPRGEQKLLEWVKPYISDVKKFHLILDPRLQGCYSLKSAAKLASLANRCLVRHAKSRPNMSEVFEMVQQIVESTETGATQPTLKSSNLDNTTSGERKKKHLNLKKKIGDFKLEGRRLVWRGWIPRLIKIS